MKTTGHVQFKPASVMLVELEIIAKKWDISVNQVAKNILALSLNFIDIRCYGAIYCMAKANKNINTFEECANHMGSFLKGHFDDVRVADFNKVHEAIQVETDRYIRARE